MELPKRKPNRLDNYDYSQNGVYFITICVDDRKPILSKVVKNTNTVGATCGRPNDIQLSQIGKIVENEIKHFNKYYQNVYVDNYVIMPNHIHLLISINNNGRPQVAPTISRIVQQFKGKVTKLISKSIWQKDFYDHIIRDEDDYNKRYKYIEENPIKWEEDKYFIQKKAGQ